MYMFCLQSYRCTRYHFKSRTSSLPSKLNSCFPALRSSSSFTMASVLTSRREWLQFRMKFAKILLMYYSKGWVLINITRYKMKLAQCNVVSHHLLWAPSPPELVTLTMSSYHSLDKWEGLHHTNTDAKKVCIVSHTCSCDVNSKLLCTMRTLLEFFYVSYCCKFYHDSLHILDDFDSSLNPRPSQFLRLRDAVLWIIN